MDNEELDARISNHLDEALRYLEQRIEQTDSLTLSLHLIERKHTITDLIEYFD